MKCAMEMKIAVEEKLAKEELERQIREKKRFEEKMKKYLIEDFPRLNEIMEERLLKGNGKAVFMINQSSDKGFYFFSCKNYMSYPKNELPYWSIIADRSVPVGLFHLEHYISFLEGLCYEVSTIKKSFLACSSTGRSTKYMDYIEFSVKIPENPCE